MIKNLTNYSLKNQGRLPRSFTPSAVNGLYLKLKMGKVEISPRFEELLLFTMDKLGMDAEIVDLCDSQSQKTDTHTYYISEALLRMKFKDKYYTEVLEGAEIIKDGDELTPC